MRKLLLLLLCLPLLALANPSTQPVGFTYKGKPIKPVCIAYFNASMTDLPFIRSIDVGRCENSNTAYQNTHKDLKGRYFFYVNNRNPLEGVYYYKVVGRSKNGVFVLHTYNSGGGSGVFGDLLFVRLSRGMEPIYQDSTKPKLKPALVATLLGYVEGGDRCSGGIKAAKIKGDRLFITQYPQNNLAIECKDAKHYVIDLNHLKDNMKGA